MDFSAIMSLPLEWLSIGSFVPMYSPSGFGILLTHSSRRQHNAQWERSLERNGKNEWRPGPDGLDGHGTTSRGYKIDGPLIYGRLLLTWSRHRDNKLPILL